MNTGIFYFYLIYSLIVLVLYIWNSDNKIVQNITYYMMITALGFLCGLGIMGVTNQVKLIDKSYYDNLIASLKKPPCFVINNNEYCEDFVYETNDMKLIRIGNDLNIVEKKKE